MCWFVVLGFLALIILQSNYDNGFVYTVLCMLYEHGSCIYVEVPSVNCLFVKEAHESVVQVGKSSLAQPTFPSVGIFPFLFAPMLPARFFRRT